MADYNNQWNASFDNDENWRKDNDQNYRNQQARGQYDAQQNKARYVPDNDDNRDFRGNYGNRNNYGASRDNRYRQDDDRYKMGGYGMNRRDEDDKHYGMDYNPGGFARVGNTGGSWNDSGHNADRPDYDRDRFGSYGFNSGYNEQYRGDRKNRGDHNESWWDRTTDKISSWLGRDDSDSRQYADRSRMADHRGKGPKGYQRSAERIREDVCDRLSDDPYVDASEIEVQIQGDEVILTGVVSDRDSKRRAEDLVESIPGVRNVENRLRVGYQTADYNRNTSNHNYTRNSDNVGEVGDESGTTNEIIRNMNNPNERRS